MHRIYSTPFADIYPLYMAKVERKNQNSADIDVIIEWLTGYNQATLHQLLADNTTCKDFFDQARINRNASLITGSICGIKVQEIEDPLMQKIRYLDKLIDELAQGKSMEKILRS